MIKIYFASNWGQSSKEITDFYKRQSPLKEGIWGSVKAVDDINDSENLNFVEKEYFKYKDENIYLLDFDDYNFRLAFQVENNYNIDDEKIGNIINKWSSTKKIFRHIKRFDAWAEGNPPLGLCDWTLFWCACVWKMRDKDALDGANCLG